MEGQENKVLFGLENVHYATYTETGGEITYDTPKPLPGGVEISVEPQGDMIKFYADNIVYYQAPNNQGYEGTLTIASIPEGFATDCLGEELDTVDGVLTEKSDAKPKPFALLFEFDGDVKSVRQVLYNCTASRPTVASSTKTDSVEPNTNELSFSAGPRATDKAVKTKTAAGVPDEIYNNWYKAVYEKTPAGA
ncbi:TPA: phage tail protein [Listeria monocytogenes]|uniref:major tail protein n=1 Tax=Listeria TaxID=1637 RepID=UPI00098656AF|nr:MULTISPECIES: major tail protein [Listeria]EAC3432709.1 phage tail protein [Listeria monocytogenes]EAC7449647.1 phage tail protein [Listeria monocytogenes]EAC9583796.1 phage tail protein [Listeria monocytogenes]EAD0559961.1 phage tail protein [Listeria monocytogenes]EAD1254723.1 phage tail protein [Listeria monocytogenes]